MGDNVKTQQIPDAVLDQLRQSSTATVSGVLRSFGFNSMYLEGLMPVRPDLKMIGRAFTLRFVPIRPDLTSPGPVDNTTNKQRIAVESVGPGDVLVMEARGNTSAGTLGDLLATRIWKRGAEGVVSDGAFRDYSAFREIDMPTYCRGRNPNVPGAAHHPIEINGPIVCSGVTVLPGDVILGDADGVVVIPFDIAAHVAEKALEQEQLEAFILEKIRGGSAILGVNPPNEETLAEYRRHRQQNQD
jgi:regulator of RNase E activity RraA